jgi:pyruvate ferredoxin oxidoreductase beta subunit/phenylglyoxylate dehydrogenase beta subunit
MSYIDIIFEREDLASPGLSMCAGCGAELILRTTLKVFGKNTVVGIPPGCLAGGGATGWNFDNGLKVPVHIPLLTNTASLLSGVKQAFLKKGKDDINVIAIAGDGATSDAGMQSLSGSAERGENIVYICYDNEGYMNTGFQRSGTTCIGSRTSTTPPGKGSSGKRQFQKDMPLIMAMHNIAYVATISPANMKDMVTKLEKAKSIKKGFSYIHAFAPCPTGWKSLPEDSIKIAKKALKTNYFPLFEAENGIFKLNYDNKKPEPVVEFIKMLGKYKHCDENLIQRLQEFVDQRYEKIKKLASNCKN